MLSLAASFRPPPRLLWTVERRVAQARGMRRLEQGTAQELHFRGETVWEAGSGHSSAMWSLLVLGGQPSDKGVLTRNRSRAGARGRGAASRTGPDSDLGGMWHAAK